MKLTKIEHALLYIADMMENPMHDQYQIKNQVLNILGLYEKTKTKPKKTPTSKSTPSTQEKRPVKAPGKGR